MLQASAGEGCRGPASLDRVLTIPTLTERVCSVAGEEGNSLTIRILLLYLRMLLKRGMGNGEWEVENGKLKMGN